jgi:hypothetical protein
MKINVDKICQSYYKREIEKRGKGRNKKDDIISDNHYLGNNKENYNLKYEVYYKCIRDIMVSKIL